MTGTAEHIQHLDANPAAEKPSAEELASRPKVIEVDHLDWYYGPRQVLYDITMDVRQGEIMIIMGGSGSGKSTLLRHLVGLMPPIPGKVKLLGKDFGALKQMEKLEMRRRIGVAFQFGALFSSMTVAE